MEKTKNFFQLGGLKKFEFDVNENKRRGTKTKRDSNSIDLSDLDDFCLRKEVFEIL